MLSDADASFDSVISNGSLHEWEKPLCAFEEIHRVLRPGGRYCITDLRRDIYPVIKKLMYYTTQPKAMRAGMITSLMAAYTVCEITELLRNSALCGAAVTCDLFGLCISAKKE